MLSQCTSSFLMIRPNFIKPNEETAESNSFQKGINDVDEQLEKKSIDEFNHVVNRLIQNDVVVHAFDNDIRSAPDAVFPNNWISFHHDGTVVLYPMMANNRRVERNSNVIEKISAHFEVKKVIDLTHFESEGKFLEGTGSIVFDHQNKIAYATLSPRTSIDVLKYLCAQLGYRHFIFLATDENQPIYHTNVLLHIGNGYAIVCLESIQDIKERNDLRRMLAFTGHEVVSISRLQMKAFAGNMIQVVNQKGKFFTLLSSQAIRTLHLLQINIIGEKSELLSFDIHTIEKAGGGSIRCMMAEIFSPLKVVH